VSKSAEQHMIEQLAELEPADIEYALSGLPDNQRNVLEAGVKVFKARRSPIEYAEVVSGGTFKRAAHINLLNDILVDACYNQRFIIVSIPCRHGKSHFCSEYFPAWCLGKFPNKRIIQLSYGKETATNFSRKARDFVLGANKDIFGVGLKSSSKASDRFDVEGYDGGLLAAGAGTGVIGFGGHLIIADDLYKNLEQAYSKRYDETLKATWAGSLRSRLEPGGSIILVLARWREDDIAGWLLEQARTIPGYDPWVEIKIPAICDSEDDILGRPVGQPLWPERYNKKALYRIKASMGTLEWDAQYQQRPKRVKDSMFPPENWTYVGIEDVPTKYPKVRFWDLTAGGKDSDYLAGVLMTMDEYGQCYILDMVHEKFTGRNSEHEVEKKILQTCEADKVRYGDIKVKLEQTAGLGKAVANNYVTNILAGFDVEAVATGSADKISRASTFAAQQQGGHVRIVKKSTPTGPVDPPWLSEFLDEHAFFPNVKHDDQVDATSHAYLALVKLRKRNFQGALHNPNGMTTSGETIEGFEDGPDYRRGRKVVGRLQPSKRAKVYSRKIKEKPVN